MNRVDLLTLAKMKLGTCLVILLIIASSAQQTFTPYTDTDEKTISSYYFNRVLYMVSSKAKLYAITNYYNNIIMYNEFKMIPRKGYLVHQLVMHEANDTIFRITVLPNEVVMLTSKSANIFYSTNFYSTVSFNDQVIGTCSIKNYLMYATRYLVYATPISSIKNNEPFAISFVEIFDVVKFYKQNNTYISKMACFAPDPVNSNGTILINTGSLLFFNAKEMSFTSKDTPTGIFFTDVSVGGNDVFCSTNMNEMYSSSNSFKSPIVNFVPARFSAGKNYLAFAFDYGNSMLALHKLYFEAVRLPTINTYKLYTEQIENSVEVSSLIIQHHETNVVSLHDSITIFVYNNFPILNRQTNTIIIAVAYGCLTIVLIIQTVVMFLCCKFKLKSSIILAILHTLAIVFSTWFFVAFFLLSNGNHFPLNHGILLILLAKLLELFITLFMYKKAVVKQPFTAISIILLMVLYSIVSLVIFGLSAVPTYCMFYALEIIHYYTALAIVSFIFLCIFSLCFNGIMFGIRKIVEAVDIVHKQIFKDEQYMQMLLSKEYTELLDQVDNNTLNINLFKISMNDISHFEEIGSGAAGLILKGMWNKQTVAIKLFRGNIDKELFRNELTLLCSLRHPNIVAMFGAIMEEPRFGYVMEFCANGSLARMVDKKFKFTAAQKISILLGIARGMVFLHAKQVIHRDLKLDNVLIDDQLNPKIADLGISKLLNEQQVQMTAIIGTSWYMAPEVYKGESYNQKCDVFSFGIMMYQIVFDSSKPYGSAAFMIEQKVAMEPEFRPKIPNLEQVDNVLSSKVIDTLINLMKRCWKHESLERPSFEEVCQELEHLQDI